MDSFNTEPWEESFIEEIRSSKNHLLSLNAKLTDASTGDEKLKLKCNVCDKSLATGMHYQCLKCAEYNLCEECFKSRKFNGEHKTGHPVVHFQRPNIIFGKKIKEGVIIDFEKIKEAFHERKHEGVTCDGTDCGTGPLIGVRLTCATCTNFDLCLKCFERENYKADHSNDHPVIVNDNDQSQDVKETQAPKANNQVNVDLLKKLFEKLGIEVNVENAVKSNFETLDVENTNMAMFLEFFQDGNLSIDSPRHEGVICKGKDCNAQNFIIDRYKCTICKDYDLCGNCFERRNFSGEHLKGHLMVRFSGPNEIFGEKISPNEIIYERLKKIFDNVSHNYICDGCKVNPIKGLRIRCDECNNFDLCSICYESKKSIDKHNADHALVINKLNMAIKVDDITNAEKIEDITYGNMNTATYNKNKVSSKMLEYTPIVLVRGVSEEKFQEYVHQEVMTELNSSYVKKYFGVGSTVVQIDTLYYIVSEHLEKHTLESLLSKGEYISLRDKLQIACNVATAMRKFHEKNIVHESIRPDNIFINKDFIAKVGGKGVGNLKYFNYNKGPLEFEKSMPKEFFNPEKWDSKLDIFTFGLTLHYLFSGQKHEYDTINNKEVVIKINAPSPYFAELIGKCLSEKPADRPTAEYVEKTLKTYLRIVMGVINFTDYFFISDNRKDQHFTQVYNLITEKLKTLNSSK